MPRIVYSSTVARSKRLPSARRWSGIERKTSNSGDAIRQPPIRVVADRFRHFRSRESPTALKVQRTAQPCIENPFYTSICRGVEDAAWSAGYSVILCNADRDIDKERQY